MAAVIDKDIYKHNKKWPDGWHVRPQKRYKPARVYRGTEPHGAFDSWEEAQAFADDQQNMEDQREFFLYGARPVRKASEAAPVVALSKWGFR